MDPNVELMLMATRQYAWAETDEARAAAGAAYEQALREYLRGV